MDEVGRGSLAGPVTVGLAVVDRGTSDAFPQGLADSKHYAIAVVNIVVGIEHFVPCTV